jgi:hypothetical protein
MFTGRVPEGTRTLDIQNHKQRWRCGRKPLCIGVSGGLCFVADGCMTDVSVGLLPSSPHPELYDLPHSIYELEQEYA